jgi:hypothetical protein
MRRSVLTIIITVAVILVAIQPLVTSQDTEGLQPTFGQAIAAVRRAESAGATPSEIAGLVQLLNRALDLNREALELNSTSQSQQRSALLSEVNQTLATVNSQSDELAATSAQRSYYNLIMDYAGGVVAAIVATFAFILLTNLYREYRIRRTFQMRVSRR